jgi:hypothetical protein
MSDSEEYCNSDDTDDGIDINDEIIDVNNEISEDSGYEDDEEYREMINSNINSQSLYDDDCNIKKKKEKRKRVRIVKEKKIINYLEKKEKSGKKFLSKIKHRKAYKNMFNPRLPPLNELENTSFNDSSSIDINDSPQDYPSLNKKN